MVHVASWPDERLFRRPKEEDHRSPQEGHDQDRGRPRLLCEADAQSRGAHPGSAYRSDGPGAWGGHGRGCPRVLRPSRLPSYGSTAMTNAVEGKLTVAPTNSSYCVFFRASGPPNYTRLF